MKTITISKSIDSPSYINLHHVAESGQCFRMEQIKIFNFSYFNVLAKDKFLRVLDRPNEYTFECADEDADFWRYYFDLNTDYSLFHSKIRSQSDSFLNRAVDYGKGLRILHQDFWEALVSFIISQNNNIPRIKKIIREICFQYGKLIEYEDEKFYGFPTRDELSQATIEDFQKLGLGYRSKYLYELCRCDTSLLIPAEQSLIQLKGVGPKVAKCALLYGAYHLDEAPVDVWMKRLYEDVYNGSFDDSPYEGFRGYIQMLQFYYYRHICGKS